MSKSETCFFLDKVVEVETNNVAENTLVFTFPHEFEKHRKPEPQPNLTNDHVKLPCSAGTMATFVHGSVNNNTKKRIM